jgi:uncharacterized protein (TIGR00290 family)
MKEKVLIAWSGGKDSVLALDELQRRERYEAAALLTTITQDYDRVSMHGVHRVLIERQAEALGVSVEKVCISKGANCGEYESKMREVLEKYLALGVSSVVFGDIFLEDVRKYREDNLSKIGMKGIFPIWGADTTELAYRFIDSGYKAVVTCVDLKSLDKIFVGSSFDKRFLSELPAGVDRCGENGEFHSFVYDGPMFGKRILYERGEVVSRGGHFCYCDLILIED